MKNMKLLLFSTLPADFSSSCWLVGDAFQHREMIGNIFCPSLALNTNPMFATDIGDGIEDRSQAISANN